MSWREGYRKLQCNECRKPIGYMMIVLPEESSDLILYNSEKRFRCLECKSKVTDGISKENES